MKVALSMRESGNLTHLTDFGISSPPVSGFLRAHTDSMVLVSSYRVQLVVTPCQYLMSWPSYFICAARSKPAKSKNLNEFMCTRSLPVFEYSLISAMQWDRLEVSFMLVPQVALSVAMIWQKSSTSLVD